MVDLETSDADLVSAATACIAKRYRPNWHVVGAALRLQTGEVVTGVHLDATVGRIAVCAEAIALGRALTEYGSTDIDTIVAVYHTPQGVVKIVSPCGMCREMIADYAPAAQVLLADTDGKITRYKILDLLPAKYSPLR